MRVGSGNAAAWRAICRCFDVCCEPRDEGYRHGTLGIRSCRIDDPHCTRAGQCASWPVIKLTISMISPTTHRLQLGNSVWLFLRHRTVYNPMIDEEVSKLLAYPEDRNMVQMEHLLAEASRSNWAINPAEVKLTWKIGTGGFGVCDSTASYAMASTQRKRDVGECRKYGRVHGRALRQPSNECAPLYPRIRCQTFVVKLRYLRT